MTSAQLTGAHHGLSEAEARRRLAAEGPNELPSQRLRSDWRIAAEVLREPMLLLLLAAASLYMMLGDAEDAIALFAAALLVIGITFVQTRRTERALHALRELSSPRALVIRDGALRRIAGREIVPGDLLVLEQGDRVAGDAEIVEAEGLQVDESLLTGESLPVEKRAVASAPAPSRIGAQPETEAARSASRIYAGTLVVNGRCVARVTATGARSELGRIGSAMLALREPPSRLQSETRRAVWILSGFGLVFCLAVISVYGLQRGDFAAGLLVGIALAMALVPEEFPVVLTVMLALGGRRLSRDGVLARRLSSIEALGSISTLCADKTGTLTENRMQLAALLSSSGKRAEVADAAADPELHRLLHAALLASVKDTADPIDRALWDLAVLLPIAERTALEAYEGLRTFDHPRARGRLVRRTGEDETHLALKGAPETIVGLSTASAEERGKWLAAAETLARGGHRVLAVAERFAPAEKIEEAIAAAGELPSGLHIVGLLSFADPVRADAPEAIAECARAGIRVIMVSGDHAETARAIAQAVGLATDAPVLTGDDLERFSDDELAAALRNASVFARVLPHHKLRLVQALQGQGETVAMTGDGVNDAPALRAADVGIALGGRGTDVAREAAAIVITDDDFGSIVAGIRDGRRIFDNLRRAVTYIVAVHVPTAGMVMAAAIAGLPPVLLPIHIAFLELIIDPACSLVFEPEPAAPDTMRRPPRPATTRLFALPNVLLGLVQGTAVLLAAGATTAWAVMQSLPIEVTRTIGFATIVLGNIGLLFANRTASREWLAAWRRGNRTFWWLVGLSVAALALVAGVPPLREVFHLAPLGWEEWGMCVAAVIVAILLVELLRRFRRAA
jgi:Ca2+-transporting ATPase